MTRNRTSLCSVQVRATATYPVQVRSTATCRAFLRNRGFDPTSRDTESFKRAKRLPLCSCGRFGAAIFGPVLSLAFVSTFLNMARQPLFNRFAVGPIRHRVRFNGQTLRDPFFVVLVRFVKLTIETPPPSVPSTPYVFSWLVSD